MGLYAFRRRKASGVPKASDVAPVAETKRQPDYSDYTVPELKDIASDRDIDGYSEMKKAELIEALQK